MLSKTEHYTFYLLGHLLCLQCTQSLQRRLPHGTSGWCKQPSMLQQHYLPCSHLTELGHCTPAAVSAGWPGTLRIAVAATWPGGQLRGLQDLVPTAVAGSSSTPFLSGCVIMVYSPVGPSSSVPKSQHRSGPVGHCGC